MKLLAFDIGGTFVKYAFMDVYGNIEEKGKIPTSKNSRSELIESMGKIYDCCPEVEGIAVSMPGIIDTEHGHCLAGGVALPYNTDFYIGDALYERCPVKIYIGNDAKCAAMAEAACGSLSDVNDGFVILFGTMIGGAIIKDKKLHMGSHFAAGEVSYMGTANYEYPNVDNIWGNRCGTPRLCKMYAEKKGLDPEKVNGEVFFNAMDAGDEDAKICLDAFTMEISIQLFNLQNIVDPERFAIGGGISARPVFIEYIKKNVDKLYAQFPNKMPKPEIVRCQFMNDANLIGAAQALLRAEKPSRR